MSINFGHISNTYIHQMRNRFYRPVEIYLIWNKKKLSSILKTEVQYLCLIHLSLISGGGFLWLLWVYCGGVKLLQANKGLKSTAVYIARA